MSEITEYMRIVGETDSTEPQVNEFKMLCPVCGGEYSHVMTMKTVDGEDNYKAWSGRGDADIVYVMGECGHNWKVLFGFHKGQTYIQVWEVDNTEMKAACGRGSWEDEGYEDQDGEN